jgi:methylase of polypeptide subunit release factors
MGSTVHLYDIDNHALAVAKQNARQYSLHAHYYIGNVLDPWMGNYTVVLANLPYVPDSYPINTAATFEPKLALFSGTDGLDHYRLLWRQVTMHQGPPAQHIITEALPEQHQALEQLAAASGYYLANTLGYAQHFMRSIPKRAA